MTSRSIHSPVSPTKTPRAVTIGSATLYLGDCRTVLPCLPTGGIDFLFTDPPYGHRNNDDDDLISRREKALGKPKKGSNGEVERRPILNDGDEADGLFRTFVGEAGRLLGEGATLCCCCGGGGPDPQFARWSLELDEHLAFKQMIVWDKGKIGMGWHYRRSYETILVAHSPAGTPRWYDTTNAVENILRPGDHGIRKIIPNADQHPTEKPVALVKHFLGLHTRPGDIVLDPFMGSGTTGVACAEMDRLFIGIELDPHWFTVARSRIAAATNRCTGVHGSLWDG